LFNISRFINNDNYKNLILLMIYVRIYWHSTCIFIKRTGLRLQRMSKTKFFIRGGPVIGEKAIFHMGWGFSFYQSPVYGLVRAEVGPAGTSTSSGGTSANSGGGGTGTGKGPLTLNLTDSTFSDAKSVLVTFSEVQVHSSGGSWVTVLFTGGSTSRTCDLKKLVGAQNVLGTGSLPAGHYTMIRLVVTQSTLYFDNQASGSACDSSIPPPMGQNAPLEIPSGEIKLNREFDVTAGRPTTILLDFMGIAPSIRQGIIAT
jgi:hypothetical protein